MSQGRWVCSHCRANNMLTVGACHQCGKSMARFTQPMFPPPTGLTQHVPTPAEPTVAMRFRRRAWWPLVLFGLVLLILALNNPSKADYSLWAKGWLVKNLPAKDDEERSRNVLSAMMIGNMLEGQTQAYNYGLLSVFDTYDARGAHVAKVLGIFKQFVPLKTPPPEYFAGAPQKPAPLGAPFQPPPGMQPLRGLDPSPPQPQIQGVPSDWQGPNTQNLTPPARRPIPAPPADNIPPANFGLVNPHGTPPLSPPTPYTGGMGGGSQRPRIGGSSQTPAPRIDGFKL